MTVSPCDAACATTWSVASKLIGPPSVGCACAQLNTTRTLCTPAETIVLNCAVWSTLESKNGSERFMPTNPWGTGAGLAAWWAGVWWARLEWARAGTATASAQATATKSIPADRLRHDIGAECSQGGRFSPG